MHNRYIIFLTLTESINTSAIDILVQSSVLSFFYTFLSLNNF